MSRRGEEGRMRTKVGALERTSLWRYWFTFLRVRQIRDGV